MPSLPAISGRAAVRALAKDGWVVARQRGSHVILVKEGHPATLSVPDHREIAKGTLRSLIRASGLEVASFIELTKK
jgi:predicted RNA binding protein YcfA (HicA-like mRNA interferase family)